MIFESNNGRIIELTQARPDGPITVTRWDKQRPGEGRSSAARVITAGDMVQLLNLYNYIIDNDIYNPWINPHGQNKEDLSQ